MDPAGTLLQTPLFRDLSIAAVEELLPDLRDRSFGRGETVWLEGARAEALVVIAEGQLKAYRVSREGREVIVAVYPSVSTTGEVGLFHPVGIRWLSLAAMAPTRCLMIRRAPLLSFLSRHPATMVRMLEQLSTIAVQAAYSFSGVAFDDIGRRVAGLLLRLAEEHGEDTPDGIRIRLRLSQADLAAHVAASRENVNRALASLVARGVVSHRDGHVRVHDLAALEAAVQAGETGRHAL
jgi:CRP/FNR family transcriptional regulator